MKDGMMMLSTGLRWEELSFKYFSQIFTERGSLSNKIAVNVPKLPLS